MIIHNLTNIKEQITNFRTSICEIGILTNKERVVIDIQLSGAKLRVIYAIEKELSSKRC